MVPVISGGACLIFFVWGLLLMHRIQPYRIEIRKRPAVDGDLPRLWWANVFALWDHSAESRTLLKQFYAVAALQILAMWVFAFWPR